MTEFCLFVFGWCFDVGELGCWVVVMLCFGWVVLR